LNCDYTRLKPRIDPEIGNNALGLNKYRFENLEIYGQYVLNTMNEVFYPNEGISVQAKISRSLNNKVEVDFADPPEPEYSGSVNGFTKFTLNFEKRFPFKGKITGILGAATGLTFYDNLEQGDVSYTDYGYGSKYYMGGAILRPRTDNYIFYGLYEGELPVTQFMMLTLGLQYNVLGNIYLTPHVNIASVGFEDFNEFKDHAFAPKGDWKYSTETSSLISAGVTASVNSFLGPIQFDLSWVNDIDKIRFFFGIGLQFNRSN
jgi:NTE family protein